MVTWSVTSAENPEAGCRIVLYNMIKVELVIYHPTVHQKKVPNNCGNNKNSETHSTVSTTKHHTLGNWWTRPFANSTPTNSAPFFWKFKLTYPQTTGYRAPNRKCNIEQRIDPTYFSLHKYHKLSLHLFKDLMKFAHKRNHFNCFLASSKSVISVFTREGTSYYCACEDFFYHINFW